MVLFNHIKGDLSCLGNTACLLSNNTNNFLLCTNEEAKFQGAYLHCDKNDEEWVRSGSKAGAPDKGFADRNKEHYRGAKSAINDPPSTFYDTFPARNSPRAQRIGSKSWEHLEQHVAAGFNPNDPVISEFKKDYDDGGLCFFSSAEIQKVRQISMNGREENQKIFCIVAYLFELAYDLALDPRKNVSSSPGFEAFGLF
mmetsp:Transcript_11258/g.19944  ORF Transcript_11258/g.19944 Transcript_11258/m.19944 type:complete len:198 (+) Transcript_11258:449-1042(+)